MRSVWRIRLARDRQQYRRVHCGRGVRQRSARSFIRHAIAEGEESGSSWMNASVVVPVIDVNVRQLCRFPYPGHPKGCPNFGKSSTCPPRAALIHELLDLNADVFVVWNRFDFGAHVERMKKRHPEWSDRQAACCLYWQGTARKELNGHIRKVLRRERKRLVVVRRPEACGVDVTSTVAEIGIKLEWPPVRWAYQVALLGTKPRGRIRKTRVK